MLQVLDFCYRHTLGKYEITFATHRLGFAELCFLLLNSYFLIRFAFSFPVSQRAMRAEARVCILSAETVLYGIMQILSSFVKRVAAVAAFFAVRPLLIQDRVTILAQNGVLCFFT